jgi:malate synthase
MTMTENQTRVLTDEAIAFVTDLERRFGPRRWELLQARADRRARIAAGETLDFLPETLEVREGDWTVAPPARGLEDRRVEITGPVDRKMIINALNSGARGFMADFEDSLSPTWENVVSGQANLIDAIDGTIEFGDGYRLADEVATLLVRPRGWHLHDKHLDIDGRPISASLLDAGLFLFHNASRLLERGAGPYFYLPKMESHLEARLWNDVFLHAQDALGIDRGSIRATVLIETLPAAFEMDEILYELREHSAGLNAGRWDYIFSAIKTFRERPEMVLPQRNDVKMTVPFMRAYTELLVRTCHRRGAHAMGGMAALIPSRRDPEANEKAVAGVRADKEREAGDGFDGTWVAHPDLVPVAMEEFDRVLGERPNQIERRRDDVEVTAGDLLDLASTPGAITEEGLRNDVNVGIQYISSWLRGNGAAAIYGLMEDAATAEIARSQVWQFIRHGVTLDDGRSITPELVRELEGEELERIRSEIGDDAWFEREGRPRESRELFESVALTGEEYVEFLTLPAYERLD